ncbi:MAG: reverse transcriptase domain-containing protein [Sediminibacterium sp.]|nr:reverse transcriptase domain-containing protein [Sediminibacterium sp.]
MIDIDIQGFFGNIDYELLLKAVTHYCKNKWVILYVERWLKAGVIQQDGKATQTELGTPQGGVISPLIVRHFCIIAYYRKNKFLNLETTPIFAEKIPFGVFSNPLLRRSG